MDCKQVNIMIYEDLESSRCTLCGRRNQNIYDIISVMNGQAAVERPAQHATNFTS